jgi:hypothetical protein
MPFTKHLVTVLYNGFSDMQQQRITSRTNFVETENVAQKARTTDKTRKNKV